MNSLATHVVPVSRFKAIIGAGDNAAIFFEMKSKTHAAATLGAEWNQIKNGRMVLAQSAFDGHPAAAMFADARAVK
jgi:hypothetical protein